MTQKSYEVTDVSGSPAGSQTVIPASTTETPNGEAAALDVRIEPDESKSSRWPCVQCFGAYHSWTPQMRIIVCLLMLNNFCGFACQSVIAPFFPRVAEGRGVSTHVVGLIFGSYAFAAFLFAHVWGKLVPRIGPRMTLVMGGSICGLASIVFGLMYFIQDTVPFTTGSFVIRITEAFGYAAFNTASFTVAARMFSETLSTVMALLEIAVGAGLAGGPGIGSALYSVGGYITPFAVLGIVMILFSIPLLRWIPSKAELKRPEDVVEGKPQYWKLLTSVSPVLACLNVFVDAIGSSFLLPILAARVAELGVSEANTGYIFMVNFAVYAVTSALVVGPVSDILKGLRFLFCGVGLAIMALGFLVVGPSPIFGSWITNSIPVVVIGLFIIGFGSSFALVPSYPLLLSTAIRLGLPDNMKTLAMVSGLWNALYSLGDTVGPIMGASLTETLGFPMANTIFAGVLLTLGIADCFNYVVELRKPSEPKVSSKEEENHVPFTDLHAKEEANGDLSANQAMKV